MGKAPTGTPALVVLARSGVRHLVHPYDHDPAAPAYGPEAASALGVEPGRVFKTLVVDTGSGLAVAVVPVSAQLDLKATAGALGVKKVALAAPAAAERSTGYVVGGISPIGQRTPLLTVIDDSATAFETVYVSAGRRGVQVELAPGDLITLIGARVAPVARAR